MVRTLLEIQRGEGQAPWRWIDVFQPTPEEIVALVQDHELHETSVQDCLDPGHLPKFEIVDDLTFFIVRFDAAVKEGEEESFTVGGMTNKIAAFLGPRGLITVHRMGARIIQEVSPVWKQRLASRATAPAVAFTPELAAFRISLDLIKAAVQSFEKPVKHAQVEVELLEESIFSENSPQLQTQSVLLDLYTLKRRGKVYSRMLHLLRNLLIRIEGPASAPAEEKAPFVQDLAESCDRLLLLADEVLDTANQLLNYHLSLSTHRTNEVVRVLTVFSAFFMPLTFIVGLYGMNFRHMPELGWSWGYPLVLALLAMVTIGIFIYFRRKKLM
jgi:magnesium transporter